MYQQSVKEKLRIMKNNTTQLVTPTTNTLKSNADELCSGLNNGRVLTGELYTHRNQKSNFLHLLKKICFVMIFPFSSE